MSEVYDIYFTPQGRPTRRLLSLWRAKGAQQHLMPLMQVHKGGYARPGFRSLWSKAFPDRKPIPTDAIATKDGQMTEAMLNVWLD